MFGEKAFSCAVEFSAGRVAQLGANEPLELSFLAPHVALQFAVLGAPFKFAFPPNCTGTGVILEVLGA